MSLSGNRLACSPCPWKSLPGLGLARAVLAMAAALLGTPAVAGQPATGGGLRACLDSVRQTTPEISCEYTVLLTDQERADMRRLTRERLQDASCRVTVRVSRDLVQPALTEANHIFNAPPQPVVCTIKTRDSTFDVTGTFAPQVTFKDGVAVTATPGLANVEGVNRYLAWPVVQYVNHAPGIRRELISIINVYRAQLTGK
jgi:hypothetical protein